MSVSVSRSECDAPNLDLKPHKTEIQGFKVLKLWGNENDPKVGPNDVKIPFAGYEFLFKSKKSTKIKPKPVNADKEIVSKKLLKIFKTGPHYLYKEKQQFSVEDVQGVDLQGKGKADVILFEVGTGANSYSGAIGIIDKEWVGIIWPVCY